MGAENDDSTLPCVSFKVPVRRGNPPTISKRHRNSSSSSDDEGQPSISTFRLSKTIKKGLVTTSTRNSSNKRRIQNIGSDDEEKLLDINFKSNRQIQPHGPRDMGATATVEIDTDKQHDQQTIFERAKKINQELKGKPDDKIYRGMNNYQQFYQKNDTARANASSGLVRNKGLIN
jgi:RING finger protein 113A